MGRYTTTLSLALFNTAAVGLLAVAWAYGFVAPVFVDDVSRITWVTAGLLVAVILHTTWQTYRFDSMDTHDEHVIEAAMAWPIFLKGKVFFTLGLCATVVGLIIFVGHLATDASSASSEAIAATLVAMKVSMKTAFNGTLVGIVAKLWVEVAVFIQGAAVRRMKRIEVGIRHVVATTVNDGMLVKSVDGHCDERLKHLAAMAGAGMAGLI